MNKDFLILTSNFGQKDLLKDPSEVYDNCDYIAFTDNQTELKVWKQQQGFHFSNIDNYSDRRDAKIYKILSTTFFPNYKYIVWMDANKELIVNPKLIIDEYGDADILGFFHPERNCIYQEMEIIKRLNLDDNQLIDNQKQFYNQDNFPNNIGLLEMSFFIRKNTDKIKHLEFCWCEQICKFSSIDQCSFMYCIWKLRNKNVIYSFKRLKGFANNHGGGNLYSKESPHLK